MQNNCLTVGLKEFNFAMKTFRVGAPRKNAKKKPIFPPAILSYSSGFLTIESEDKVVNIHASGEWHGKAEFSNMVVTAIALVPLTGDLVIIKYADNKLHIATTSITCTWTSSSHQLISQLTNPSLIDIFAMWRTLPAHQLHGDGIVKQYKAAHARMHKDTEKLAKKLTEYEITQDDLITLIEAKVEAKISAKI